MVLIDMLAGGDGTAAAALGLDPDVAADIQKVLTGHHADVLDQSVRPVGTGDFGRSASGTALGSHADLAHQHVIAALKEMADGLDGFALAIKQAAGHLTSVDHDSAAATTQIDSSLDQVNTTFDDASTQGTRSDQSTVGGKDPSATPPAAPSGAGPGAPAGTAGPVSTTRAGGAQ